MFLGQKTLRNRVIAKVKDLNETTDNADVKAAIAESYDTVDDGNANTPATEKLVAALEACGCEAAKDILASKDYLRKKSQWIFGGDGWASVTGFSADLTMLSLPGQDVEYFRI